MKKIGCITFFMLMLGFSVFAQTKQAVFWWKLRDEFR
jgi:hypothetical protein